MGRRKAPRKELREHKPTPNIPHRPFFAGNDVLEDFTIEEHGVRLRGDQRCHAVGLLTGDCRQQRTEGSAYCYYHDKLEQGVMAPSAPAPMGPSWSHNLPGAALYPVWPLPKHGYVLLEEPARRLIA